MAYGLLKGQDLFVKVTGAVFTRFANKDLNKDVNKHSNKKIHYKK
tara:strand:+ start:2052 stop:2186 length:135 start_codon:yes stop_codon:yes gene_type:complete